MANFNLGLDQIDQLEKAGQLTPDTANALRAKVSPISVPEAPAAPMSPVPLAQPEAAPQPANSATPFALPADQQASLASAMGISPTPSEKPLTMDFPQASPQVALEMLNAGQISEKTAAPALQNLTANDFVQPAPQAQPLVNPMAGYAAGVGRGYDKQMNALNKSAQIGAEQAAAEAGYLSTLQSELQKDQERNAAQETERQIQVEIEKGKYDELNNQLQNAKVDPSRYWSSRSFAQKSAATIGLILGGIGGGMQGNGRNLALEVLEKDIDRDIDAQKSQIEKLKDAAGLQNNLLHQMRQQFGDERQAEAAAKAFKLGQAELQLKQMAAQYKAPQVQANAEAAIGQLMVAKEAAMAQFAAAGLAKQQRAFSGDVDPRLLTEKERKQYVPGLGMANTPEDAKDLKAAIETKNNFDRKITELIELRKEYGGEAFNRDAVARGRQLSNDLLLLYKDMAKLGVLSQSDEKILNEIIPRDPLEFTPFSAVTGSNPILTKLEAFKKDSDADFQQRVKTRLMNAPQSSSVSSFKASK